MIDKNLKREIILDHYNDPYNKVEKLDDSLKTYRSNNPSCIDDITIGLNIKDEKIISAYFMGEACAISTSATSILMKMIENKNLSFVRELITNYINMIEEKPYDKDILKELIVYDEIYLQPNRITCATLPVKALNNALKEENF